MQGEYRGLMCYIDYPNYYMLIFRVTQYYNYVLRMWYFIKKSNLRSMMYWDFVTNVELQDNAVQ